MNEEQIAFIKDGMLEEYDASVRPGEPFRLFKYGDLYKGGVKRTVAKDKPFKLPHFKPPIKLGSHKDETPAGGFITGLELRDDGIWAIPEFTPEGEKALELKSYRYHSPEVIWEGGGLEDPETGNVIEGPFIVGVALTHTPHLGESTALYTYQELDMEKELETVAVPKDFFESITAFFKREPKVEEPEDKRDEFEAVIQERDNYKTQLDAINAEKAEKELFASVAKEFETEEYGAAFKAIADEDGAVEKLAKIKDEEVRSWVLEKFAALSAQKDVLTEEIGDDNPLPEGVDSFGAAVDAYVKEYKVAYDEAVIKVASDKPELYKAYVGGKK